MTARLDMARRGISGSLLIFLVACAIAAVVAMTDVVGVLQSHAYFANLGMPLPLGGRLFALTLSGSKVVVPLIVIGAMVGIRRPLIPRGAIMALWLVFVLMPGLQAVRTFADPIGRRLPVIWEFHAVRLGLGLAFCIGATVYLTTSRRVAQTFARPLVVRGVFD